MSFVTYFKNFPSRLTQKVIDMGSCAKDRQEKFTDLQRQFYHSVKSLKSDVRTMKEWKNHLHLDKDKNLQVTKSGLDILGNKDLNLTLHHFAEKEPEKYEQSIKIPFLAEKVKIEAFYARHVEMQKAEMDEIRSDESVEIPDDLDFSDVSLGLSHEEQEKFALYRPLNIAAASRIPGVTPMAILSLLRVVKKRKILAQI